MSIFNDEIQKREADNPSEFIKTDELLKGKWTIQNTELVKANNPQYGAGESDGLFKRGVLKDGETIRYHFKDEKGGIRKYDSKGVAFYNALNVPDLKQGDTVTFTRMGEKGDTRWEAKKVS